MSSAMDVEAPSKKRAYGATDGPAPYGADERSVAATDDNFFRIPNAPPYRVIVPAGQQLDTAVMREDFDALAKLVEVILFAYKFDSTMRIYLMYDAVDKAYQLTAALPMNTPVTTNTLVALYRVKPMLITQRPWAEISQTPDSKTGDLTIMQNIVVGLASMKRSHVTITNTMVMQYESEATQRSPDDFSPLHVKPSELSDSFIAQAAVGAAPAKRPAPVQVPAQAQGPAPADVLPSASLDNPLRIPSARQKYRIIVPPKMMFADVVEVPDLDILRKIAQVVFYFYETPKTIFVYVSYDANDRAYEVTFSCPRDARVGLSFVTSIYSMCPMLITRKPTIAAARGTHPITGESVITQNVTLRVASYRRTYLTIPETSMLMWDTQTVYVPAQEEADIIRPAKRPSTLQWGKTDKTPAGRDAAGRVPGQ